MPKSRELTVFERGMIVGLHKGKHSATDIQKILGIPRATCIDVINKFENEGLTEPLPRSGRPPLLTEREGRTLVRVTKDNRKESLEEIVEEFNSLGLTQVSTSTARRVLHKNDFVGRIGKRKPFVSETNRVKRLKWCRERRGWDKQWDTIIWSDESRFLLFENDGQQWVWRRPHEKYDVECLVPTVKSNGEGVMVWGCFVKNRLGPLVVLEGRITGQVYKKLLEDYLVPFIEGLDDETTYVFQDDNAPVHRANSVLVWKEENLIHSLPWPAQSPDLNPIEHLWDHLGRKLHEHKPIPKNKRELVLALEDEWSKIDESVLENLVNSMPRRVIAVIGSEGNPTPY